MSTLALGTRSSAPAVLGDAVPGARVRDAALIITGAGLTTLGAQIAIHIPPSPVPVTGQTLAVIIAGATLGTRRGAASQLLYLLLGLILPIYADGNSGPHIIWGATGGYLIGFILAAATVGYAAEHHADRRLLTALITFTTGQLIIFGIGVPWLKIATNMPWNDAIHNGFTIFIIGGIIKALIAAATTPTAWRLVHHIDHR